MTAVNRLLVIHLGADTCLYDHIWNLERWRDDESDDLEEFSEKCEEKEVAGSKKEQEQRQNTVKLLKAMYKFSFDHDLGVINKACFHTPSQTRATSFAPTYKPLFGTLPRPKQLVHPTLQSLVFNQNEQELVTARHKKLNLLAACFYGIKTTEGEAREYVEECLIEFAHRYRDILMGGDMFEELKKLEELDVDRADCARDQPVIMAPFADFDDFALPYYNNRIKGLGEEKIMSEYFESHRGFSDRELKFDDEPHVSFEISTEH